MDSATLRAWWWQRQGLDGSWAGASASTVLERAGWARSVGGANPYLALFSRAGTSRSEADAAASKAEIHELPSARGCTYVVPQSDFALALKVSQGQSESGDIVTAKKFLGVTEEELSRLAQAVVEVLDDQPKSPAEIKNIVGDAARSLGPEGKKRGVTTTLPLVLGRLQNQGEIRRQPVGGRLDQQRYGYVRWNDNPLRGLSMSAEEAMVELARHYFWWIGVASLSNFQWFSALGVAKAKAALEPLGLLPVGDMLAMPEDADALKSYVPPKEPHYSLISSLDSLFLLRRDIHSHLDAADLKRHSAGEKGLVEIGGLQDLSNNAIVDRGRVVGLWEFDPEAQQIVWASFVETCDAMRAAVKQMERFIRDQLGDARAFSLDSPESRKPTLKALAEMG